jgi:hypothetical protein
LYQNDKLRKNFSRINGWCLFIVQRSNTSSLHPFKVVGEVSIWQGHSAEQVKAMKDGLVKLKEQGIESLNDL